MCFKNLFLGVHKHVEEEKLDVASCLRVTCKRDPKSADRPPSNPDESSKFYFGAKTNSSQNLDPGTFYVCNINPSQNLKEALCSFKNPDPETWFENSSLQTYVADYVEFEMLGFADPHCPIKPKLSRQSQSKFCYENSTCCLTKDTSKLFGKTPCRMDFHCTNTSMYKSKVKKDIRWARTAMATLIPILFLFGCFAVVGNAAVIINSVSIFRRSLVTSKEIRAYNFLLLSLALADLLMGIYMIGTTSAGSRYVISTIGIWDAATETDDVQMSNWISNKVCSFLGAINFLSSQASVTAIVAITGIRLYGVCLPYRDINMKAIKSFVFGSWIFWIVLACLPLLNFEPVKTLFVDAIQFESNNKVTRLRYFHIQFLLEKLTKEINKFCGFDLDQGYVLKGRSYWEILFTVARKLNILNPDELKNLQFLSYYCAHRGCAPRFLVHYFNKFFYFSLSILVFNTISFTFILLGQIVIAKKTFKISAHTDQTIYSCWNSFVKYLTSSKNPLQKQRESENQQIKRRMFLIVVTDFCCWIPISIISIFYNFYTAKQPICTFLPYRDNTEEWFYIFAMIMLPINSVINPFIYSYTTRQRIKSLFYSCFVCAKKKQPNNPNLPSSGSASTVSSSI